MKNQILKISILALIVAVYSNLILYKLLDLESLMEATNISYSKTLMLRDIQRPAKINPNVKFGVASYYSYTIGDYDSTTHLVAAARDFPRKSLVLVTNLDNKNTVIVKITDFGPELARHPDRILDLSPRAFSILSGNGTSAGLLKNISAELVK